MPDPFRFPSFRPTQDGDTLAPYRPTQPEIQTALDERRKENEDGLFTTILKVPETVFGAHAIRGAIRGGAENGFEGVLEGFYRGLPTTKLTDWIGLTDNHFRETYTSDVRAAFGQTSQDGFGNFALNFIGDVLTDPSSFLTLFGKTAKGVAAGMDIAAGLAQGIKNGERAALVFKFPFMERMALGYPGLDPVFRKMGFESLSLNVAEGLDSWFAWMRTGALSGITRALTNQAIGIADPEQARKIQRLGVQLKGTRAGVESAFLQVFAQTPKEAQEYLLNSPAAQRVLREMRERGIDSFDQEHTLRAILERPAAVDMAPDVAQEASRIAGVGDVAHPIEKARVAIDNSQAMREAQVIESARTRTIGDLDEVMAEIGKRPELKAGLDKYLTNATAFMRRLGDKEMAQGILNGQFEHYVPRHITEEARRLLNARFESQVKAAGGGALNRIETFMNKRKFTDLTTVEANAVVRELGSKVTGYLPLDDIAKQAEAEAGIFSKLFDRDFIKQLRKVDPDAADFFAINPIYSDLLRARASGQALGSANFRREAIKAISKAEFNAKDLPGKAAEVQALTDQGLVPVMEGQGGRLDQINETTFVADQVGKDGRARFYLHRDRLRDHVDAAIDVEGADYDQVVGSLESARDIGVVKSKGKPSRPGLLPSNQSRRMTDAELMSADLRVMDNDDPATVLVKTSLIDERAAVGQRDLLRQARELNDKGATDFVATPGGGASRNFTAQGVVQDARKRAEVRLSDAQASVKEAELAKKRLAEIDGEIKSLKAVDAEATKAAKAAYVGGEKARKAGAKAERAGQTADRAFGRADVLQRESADRIAERAGKNFEYYAAKAEEAVGGIDELASGVNRAEAAAAPALERIAALQAERAAVAKEAAYWSSLKADAALARNPDAIKRLVDRELKETAAENAERLARARLNTKATRSAIQAQIEDLGDDFRYYRDSTFGDLKNAEQALERLKTLGTHGSEVAQKIRGYRQAAREGLIPFHSLTTAQQEAIIRRTPNAKIHFVAKRDLDAVTDYHRDLTKPDSLRKYGVVRGLDSLTSLWKAWTVGNVAFLNGRVRDVVTGFATLGMGRGGTLHRSAAWDGQKVARVFKNVMAGNGTIDELGKAVAIKGVPVEFSTADKVLNYLADNGVLDSGLIRDSIMETSATAVRAGGSTPLSDFLTTKIFSPNPTTNPFTRKGYEIANYGDNWVKVSGFIDGLKRGETPEMALDFVRNHTYTPGANATSFMKTKVARIFPFGQFSAWAIGTTTQQFLSAPGTVSWIEKMQRNAAQATGVSADMEAVLPDFVKDGLGVPYKKTEAGPAYFLFGGYLPAAEVSKLASAFEAIGKPNEEGKAGPVYRYIVGQLNPVAKLSIELLTNNDSFTGSEIEAYEGQSKELFGVAMPSGLYQTFRQIRLLAELDRLNVVNLDQARVMINAVDRGTTLGSREELPLVDRLASSAFGVTPKAYQIDVAEQVREGRREAQSRQGEAAARLRNQVEIAPKGDKRDANIEALRQELLAAAVDSAQTEAAAREYGVEPKLNKRSRQTLQFGRFGR